MKFIELDLKLACVRSSAQRSMLRAPIRPSRPIASRLIIAAISLLALDVSATTVWTWVDKDGVKHYSQIPTPGATRVEIGPSNRADSDASAPLSAASGEAQRATKRIALQKYTEFSIVQPADEETFINTGGVIPVHVRLDPPLRLGHTLVFNLDDHRLSDIDATAPSFELKDVPRGTHLLVAVVHDEKGVPLQEAAVTFYVRQTSIKQGPPRPVQPLPKQP